MTDEAHPSEVDARNAPLPIADDGGVTTRATEDMRLARLRLLSKVMDASIRVPGTDFRFGLDALVGLLPGLGDIIGAVVSGYIVFESARMGATRATLLRMLGNIGLESLAGAVPALGDLFDAAFKANVRNVRLLEAHVSDPTEVTRRSRAKLLGIGVGVVVIVGATAAFAIWVLLMLARLLTG